MNYFPLESRALSSRELVSCLNTDLCLRLPYFRSFFSLSLSLSPFVCRVSVVYMACMSVCMYVRMGRWVDGWMDGWKDGWMLSD